MRSRFWKSAAALMSVGILMTGCSSENGIMQEPEKPLERDSQFYINVAIASPSEQSTRAEAGYNNDGTYDAIGGTSEEQQIHSILFVFYNSANKYVGDTHITIDGAKGTTDDGDEVEVTTGTVGDGDGDQGTTKMNLIVPVSVAAGSLKPVKVIAYVNPTVQAGTDNDVKRSLEQALGITRELDEVKPCIDPAHPHAGFTMTNSVYYRSTPSDDEEENVEDRTRPAISVSIPSGALVANADDATQAINIHVERVVAKVSVNRGENLTVEDNILDHAYENGSDGEPIKYTLNFEILGWGLSNVERGSFLIKNYRRGGNVSPTQFDTWFQMTNMNKAEADNNFNDLTNWNYAPVDETSDNWFSKGYRSFWACSPTYFSGGSYPEFSDEYSDKPDNYNLIYHSFEDIISFDRQSKTHKKNADGSAVFVKDYGTAVGNSLYTLEHTMESEVVTDHQKRAVTCALVIGQYTLTSEAEHGNITPRTFFVRNGVKANGETGSWIIPDEESLYKRVLSSGLNTVLYINLDGKYKKVIWGEGTDTEALHYITAKEKEYFEIVHPDKVVTSRYTTGAEGETYTPNYTPNRFVSVQLKNNAAVNEKFYLLKGDGNYYPVKTQSPTASDATLVEANRALYGVLSVEKYHNGYAFFAVPIEHIWGKTEPDGNPTPKIGDKGFSAKLGQYGIVRNHFYQLKINGISGIGTGIGDPTSPIVPNVDEEKYYVKTEMRVMKWRMMPEQQVILKP